MFHCFGNWPDQAMDVIALGHLVSFTGIVTFKNAALVRETAPTVSEEDSYMVETDCPYLAPVPYRGENVASRFTPGLLRRRSPISARGCRCRRLRVAPPATAEAFFRFAAPRSRDSRARRRWTIPFSGKRDCV